MGRNAKRGVSKSNTIHSPEKVPENRSVAAGTVQENGRVNGFLPGEELPSDQKRKASLENKGKAKKTKLSPEEKSGKMEKLEIAVGDKDSGFLGEPFSLDESKQRWPKRYMCKDTHIVEKDDSTGEEKKVYQARHHYSKAIVDEVVFDLFDDAYMVAGEGNPDNIARIVEMFTTVDNELYIATQWFYRAQDTVIKSKSCLIDSRRVFLSDIIDDNSLNSIRKKVKIVQLSPKISAADREKALDSADLYFDMRYSLKHFTFKSADEACPDSIVKGNSPDEASVESLEKAGQELELNLLDVYSGCGALSSGLCLGAAIAGVKLNHRWAVDFDKDACQSLEMNHPETKVRNERAEDFLELLKEWEKLCKEFQTSETSANSGEDSSVEDSDHAAEENGENQSEEFEVQRFLAICYGDPNKTKEKGLYLKVRWKGYPPSYDTWEPIENLSNCKESMKEFVTAGYHDKMLPLPGDVDFLCGGPPCQGLSGHNRYRDFEDPLNDPKNQQIVVFMNMIDFLKPKYVLMENVADMLKFKNGTYSCYALGRLVSMCYQTRLGIMAAGAYGVSQCRMRVFIWASQPSERLPHFPLPTHEVSKKGVVINEYKECVVCHEDGQPCILQKSVLLGDVISDLPKVTNDEQKDEMEYGSNPLTDFQKYIRLKKKDIFINDPVEKDSKQVVYEHRPLKLNVDDFERVCEIPKRKGANFRDLPGLIIDANKKVQLDPTVERPLCKSGKPLVPDYAISFEEGKSTKCFGRLATDDIVATVVTRAEPHNQAIIHPEQDRVLTPRENARLQGFPDCYRLFGPIKERYKQVGNAVSFSVSIPLGYALAKANLGETLEKPFELPFKFPNCLGQLKNLRKPKNGSAAKDIKKH